MKYLILCLLVAGALAAPYRKLQRNSKGGGTIVGGADASEGQFPYQLSFQDVSFGLQFHFCGASIYSANWGICAGHCVVGEDYDNPRNLDVVAGELDLKTDSGFEQRQHVIQIILNSAFSSATLENDISLLKFESDLTFGSSVAAIPIPPSGYSFDGDNNCQITGWGSLAYGSGQYPDVLQWTTVPIITDAECRDDYRLQIFDSNVCAGDNGKDTCQGDSGGPMACQGMLAGIVSWGKECALSGYPGIYTEVSYFNDWIVTNAV